MRTHRPQGKSIVSKGLTSDSRFRSSLSAIAKRGKIDSELATGWLFVATLCLLGFGLEIMSIPRDCHISPPLRIGSNTDVTMIVKHDMSCPAAVDSRISSVDQLQIVSTPQAGTVSQRGRTGLVYRPERHSGSTDFFAFKLHGKLGDHDVDTLVRVSVIVI